VTETNYRDLFTLEPEALRCPERYYEALKAEGPAPFVDEIESYVVTNYDDIARILRDTETFSNANPTGPDVAGSVRTAFSEAVDQSDEARALLADFHHHSAVPVLIGADPPLHDRQRALVSHAFRPSRIAQMETYIEQIANELIDGFIGGGEFEVVEQFSLDLPLRVIVDLLGLPHDDVPRFKAWSEDFRHVVGNPRVTSEDLLSMARTQVAFDEYFAEAVEDRRAHPREDLITDIVQAELDGESLGLQEMLSALNQFFVAGHETTMMMITSALYRLVHDDDLMAAVRRDISLLPALLEETLRLHPPVQGLFRVTTKDAEIAGVSISKGSYVYLAYAAGNRDPAVFERPEDLDLQRRARPHFAFGQGVHFCIGAPLTRAEGRIGLSALLSRLDNLRDLDQGLPDYQPSYIGHGLTRLRLSFDRAE
jgi:cytochrome P450